MIDHNSVWTIAIRKFSKRERERDRGKKREKKRQEKNKKKNVKPEFITVTVFDGKSANNPCKKFSIDNKNNNKNKYIFQIKSHREQNPKCLQSEKEHKMHGKLKRKSKT